MPEFTSPALPFDLRLLGRIDLRDAGGHEVRSVLAQPKRLALLVYLALSPHPGFVRRDLLLGLFWPEVDQERARGALRKALHYLRRSLGDHVIEGRGDEEVRIGGGLVQTDLKAFDQALDRGDLEAALGLYAGEFFPGVFVSDAPGFQSWLDGERDRLRNRAIAAGWALAEARLDAADAEGAVRWADHAYALSPLSESAVRSRMDIFARSGDRAAAIRAFEEFEARLSEELGLPPGAETRALAESIRGSAGRTEPRQEGDSVAPASHGSESSRDTRTLPFPFPQAGGQGGVMWRVRRSGLPRRFAPATAALLAVVTVTGLGWSLRPGPASPPSETLDPTRVAVLPFEVRGPTELDYLREGLAVLFSNALDGAGAFRAVDPSRVLSEVERAGVPISDESLSALGRITGAGRILRGSVVSAGDALQIEVSLASSDGREGGVTRVDVTGSEADLIPLVNDLTARLLASLLQESGAHLAGSAALSGTSLTALKNYLRGEEELRAMNFDQAVEWFQAAVEDDSTFALAHYQLSSAANWAGRMELVYGALHAATRHQDRLSGRAFLLVDAAQYRGSAASEALRRYRAILERYPDDADAALELAELLYHGGPPAGRSILGSREAFEQVLVRRPTDLNSLVHLARLDALAGDSAKLDERTARILELSPAGDQTAEMRLLRAFALGETGAGREALDARERLGDQRLMDALWRSASYSGALSEAHTLGEEMIRVSDPREWVAAARLFLAHMDMGRGRARLAFEQLELIERLAPEVGLQTRALFATLPVFPSDTTEMRAILGRLRSLGGSDRPPELGIYRGNPLWERSDPSLLHFHAGILAVGLGDLSEAREAEARLRTSESEEPSLALRMAAAELTARIALAEGSPEAGLPFLEDMASVLEDEGTSANPVLPRASLRFIHAEVLRALGRDAEALTWYEAIPEDLGFDAIYLAPAQFRRGQILHALGRLDEAAHAYRKSLELWADADPALDELKNEAVTRSRVGS